MKIELVQHSGRLNYDASKSLVNKIYYRFFLFNLQFACSNHCLLNMSNVCISVKALKANISPAMIILCNRDFTPKRETVIGEKMQFKNL